MQVAGTMKQSTAVMKAMNQMMNMPKLQQTAIGMAKEMQKVLAIHHCTTASVQQWTLVFGPD